MWLDAFGRLTDIAKEALMVLFTMRPVVMYDDWRKAYEQFYRNVHKDSGYLDERQWHDAVKTLQGNFVSIGDCKYGM